jgi:hypothetical protein
MHAHIQVALNFMASAYYVHVTVTRGRKEASCVSIECPVTMAVTGESCGLEPIPIATVTPGHGHGL